MESATRKLFTSPIDIETKLNEALHGLDALRETMKDFYKERGITAFDISSMSATDFIKHCQTVVLMCNPPRNTQ